jgi:ACR3 family arsenite transporter
VSLVALLPTLVLHFGFPGEQILAQPTVIGLLAVPILIQACLNAGLADHLPETFRTDGSQ